MGWGLFLLGGPEWESLRSGYGAQKRAHPSQKSPVSVPNFDRKYGGMKNDRYHTGSVFVDSWACLEILVAIRAVPWVLIVVIGSSKIHLISSQNRRVVQMMTTIDIFVIFGRFRVWYAESCIFGQNQRFWPSPELSVYQGLSSELERALSKIPTILRKTCSIRIHVF